MGSLHAELIDLSAVSPSGLADHRARGIGDLAFDGSAGKAHCPTPARRLPTAKDQALVVASDSPAVSAWGGTLAVAALVACGL